MFANNFQTSDKYSLENVDLASKALVTIPRLDNYNNIKSLHLENNNIQILPNDFFPSLTNLTWLDLRNNQLVELPPTVANHLSLAHLLLQNNSLTHLPNGLGTVKTLKTLQLSGNPLQYPARNILNSGLAGILSYLKTRHDDDICVRVDEDVKRKRLSTSNKSAREPDTETYLINYMTDSNSDTDTFDVSDSSPHNTPFENKLECDHSKSLKASLSVQFYDKETKNRKDYLANAGKEKNCPRLEQARSKALPVYSNSGKYLKPIRVMSVDEHKAKIREKFVNELTQERCKQMLMKREKLLQKVKTFNDLKDWRSDYKARQMTQSRNGVSYVFDDKKLPFDTDPNCRKLLTRADLEKDLPDKYRKRIRFKVKRTTPRAASDETRIKKKIHELFGNLESIHTNREPMTPRTEQKILMAEIEKISEIKKKLSELSLINFRTLP